MQILPTKDFVPNRTLHSLIQIWTDSVHHRVEPVVSPTVLSNEQLLQTITDLASSGLNRFGLITKVIRFAQDSDQNRTFLAKLDGFIPLMVSFLENVENVDKSIEFLEQTLTVLGLVLEKIEDREGLKNLVLKGKNKNKKCLDSMVLVLQKGSNNSRITTTRVLKFIAIDAESELLIAENEALLTELLNLSSPENDSKLIENCLSCLIAISKPKRNKQKLVKIGVMKILSKLLKESNTSVKVTVVEKALKLVETASSTSEGRREMCEDAGFVAAILNKIRNVSNVATEHAVTTLWSVCYLFRDQKAQEAVTMANGLTKILLLIQSNCSPQVRQMCTDLLKIFRVNSKSCLSSYDTKTSHIMPF